MTDTPATDRQAMRPAKQPLGTGSTPVVGLVLALALIALGAVGIEEAVVRSGLSSAPSWTEAVANAVDDRTAPGWLVVVGGALVLTGLALLVVVVRRRPRTSLSMRATTGVYLETDDLARIVSTTIEGLEGATDTRVSTTRRRIDVRVTTISKQGTNQNIDAAVRARLEPVLSALDRAPRVKVAVRSQRFA